MSGSGDIRSIMRLVGSLESRIGKQDKEIKELNKILKALMSTFSLIMRLMLTDPWIAGAAIGITVGEVAYTALTPAPQNVTTQRTFGEGKP